MRSLFAVVVLLGACARPPAIVSPIKGDPHGGDAGAQTTGCPDDVSCGDSQVCVNCDGVGQCAPGCRRDGQCGAREICQLGTVCESCPCPPGWCVVNPCLDDDNDGFVATTDPSAQCPGKQKGDCNDRNADVHPGAVELCTNYVDDNCDGKLDERDPACVCNAGQKRCGSSWDCAGVGAEGCDKGCCSKCYDYGSDKPTCNFVGGSYCAQRYGINQNNGCNYGWTCANCGTCSTNVDPVCGRNGSTYDNRCLAEQQYSKVLHAGACLTGEGLNCKGAGVLDGGCGPSGTLYCRDTCGQASCALGACTKVGVCVTDADCPAGAPAPDPVACDAGTSTMVCIEGACASACR